MIKMNIKTVNVRFVRKTESLNFMTKIKNLKKAYRLPLPAYGPMPCTTLYKKLSKLRGTGFHVLASSLPMKRVFPRFVLKCYHRVGRHHGGDSRRRI